MSKKSKVTSVRWNPNLYGQIVSGTTPDWTVKVKNEGTESCAARVTVTLQIPLVGGDVRYSELNGITPTAAPAETKQTGPMSSNFSNAAAGSDPYTVYARPDGEGGEGDWYSNSVVVVGA